MARANKPTIPWDPHAWMGDEVHRCSFAARGLWLELLNLMRLSPKPGFLLNQTGEPMDGPAIAYCLQADEEEVEKLTQELKAAGVPSFTDDGVMFNRRMVREEEKRRKCIEAGKRGGNPNLTGKREDPKPRRGQGTKNVLFDNTLPAPEKKPRRAPVKAETIEAIYQAYPRKVAKHAALRAIDAALKRNGTTPEKLLEATQAYAAAVSRWDPTDLQYVPHPATWFNAGRYDDDRSQWERKGSRRMPPSDGIDDVFLEGRDL